MHTGYALFFLCLSLSGSAVAQWYTLEDSFIGDDFFNGFTWETFDDPTNGRVNYVNQSVALQTNLSYGQSHYVNHSP